MLYQFFSNLFGVVLFLKRTHLNSQWKWIRDRLQNFKADFGSSGSQHVNLLGSGIGKINDSVLNERAPIVNSYLNDLAVLQIVDLDNRIEGQSPVSGCQAVLIVRLTIGSPPTVVRVTVPGGVASPFFWRQAGGGGSSGLGGNSHCYLFPMAATPSQQD